MAQNLFTTGVYTVPDAARLSGVSTWRIRRWLRGYHYRSGRRKQYRSRALWNGQLDPIEGSLALGFLDLIEIRFVESFLKAGVSWATLRAAHERGVKMFGCSHPFCTKGFATDGRDIFVKLHKETGEPTLLEIARNQQVFSEITTPFLKELEFDEGDLLVRWRPQTTHNLIVLDPARSFGRPIVSRPGIPTEVLNSALKASSIADVCHWYEVEKAEVQDAAEFEQRLAA